MCKTRIFLPRFSRLLVIFKDLVAENNYFLTQSATLFCPLLHQSLHEIISYDVKPFQKVFTLCLHISYLCRKNCTKFCGQGSNIIITWKMTQYIHCLLACFKIVKCLKLKKKETQFYNNEWLDIDIQEHFQERSLKT